MQCDKCHRNRAANGDNLCQDCRSRQAGVIADTAGVKRRKIREEERIDALVAAITAKERGECVCADKANWRFEYMQCPVHFAS